jgi:hypothetical protein
MTDFKKQDNNDNNYDFVRQFLSGGISALGLEGSNNSPKRGSLDDILTTLFVTCIYFGLTLFFLFLAIMSVVFVIGGIMSR